MIRAKNLGTHILQISIDGALSSGSTASGMVPFDGFISNVFAALYTGTVTTTFDILKNGTSIYTTLPTIGTGKTLSGTGVLTSGTPSQVLAGDLLTVAVSDVGSGAPKHLCTLITVSKVNPAAMSNIADHNEVF